MMRGPLNRVPLKIHMKLGRQDLSVTSSLKVSHQLVTESAHPFSNYPLV